jgi:hypothetical protein
MGMRLEVRLPFDEPTFLERSANFAGSYWRSRYFAVTGDWNCRVLVMPDELGATPSGDNPNVRCNRWQLRAALTYEHSHVRFLALWGGQRGDGPGGTGDFVADVQDGTARQPTAHFARRGVVKELVMLLPGASEPALLEP